MTSDVHVAVLPIIHACVIVISHMATWSRRCDLGVASAPPLRSIAKRRAHSVQGIQSVTSAWMNANVDFFKGYVDPVSCRRIVARILKILFVFFYLPWSGQIRSFSARAQSFFQLSCRSFSWAGSGMEYLSSWFILSELIRARYYMYFESLHV